MNPRSEKKNDVCNFFLYNLVDKQSQISNTKSQIGTQLAKHYLNKKLLGVGYNHRNTVKNVSVLDE